MIGYQTLEEMKDEIGAYIGDSGSTRASKIESSINKWYAWIAQKWRWPTLLVANEDGVSVSADTKLLYLPKYVDKVYFLKNDTLDRTIDKWAMENFWRLFPETEDKNGVVLDFADAGEFGRKADFSSTAEQIELVSDSAADTGTVVVKGLNSAGDSELKEEVVLSGTGTVETTNTYSELYSVSASGSQSGVITASGKTSGTTYATLAPTERTARYRALRLHFVPSSSVTMKFYAKKRVNRLTFDEDTPELPVSQILVEMATRDHFAQQRKWNEAARFHGENARELLSTATRDLQVEEEIMVPYPVHRGGELGRRRGRTIVVNNG